jgi:hypothetical protein
MLLTRNGSDFIGLQSALEWRVAYCAGGALG